MITKKYTGMFEKIVPVEADMPENLKNVARNLKNFPHSERLALEAMTAIGSEIKRIAKPIPFLTRRAVVVYNPNTSDECGIKYENVSLHSLKGPQIYEATYSFHLPGQEESELCIYVDTTPFIKKQLECVEVVDCSNRVLQSHSFEHQEARA